MMIAAATRCARDRGVADPARVATLESDNRIARHHRLHATRAHLLELAGEHTAAAASYHEAARRATNLPERRHLTTSAARLANHKGTDTP